MVPRWIAGQNATLELYRFSSRPLEAASDSTGRERVYRIAGLTAVYPKILEEKPKQKNIPRAGLCCN
jgi:hypothetical protein